MQLDIRIYLSNIWRCEMRFCASEDFQGERKTEQKGKREG